jgi:hypothetical protein
MSKFDFDQRNLPDNLLPQTGTPDDYVNAVLLQLGDGVTPAPLDAFSAAIIGMLVLDGYTDQNAATFANGFWAARGEAAGTTTNSVGKQEPNKAVYQTAAGGISRLRGGGTVFYQELASVSRQLIQNAGTIPFGSPAFTSQIRVLDDAYVQSGPSSDTMQLPDLSGAATSATPDDLRPDNIRAVSVIWAAYNLEQMRLFDAVDRIIETWWNGQLPVGSDRGSKALDDFYWSSEFRLSPAARHMQYSRVLGITGGEVSTEVQPNTQFNDLWMRVIASLAEYDRQQRIGDIVSGQRTNALTLTGE